MREKSPFEHGANMKKECSTIFLFITHTIASIGIIMLCSCSVRVKHDESVNKTISTKRDIPTLLYNIATLQNPLNDTKIRYSYDYMRGKKAYIEHTGDENYASKDPENIKFLQQTHPGYYRSYTRNSIRYNENQFCTSINPTPMRGLLLNLAVTAWRPLVILGKPFPPMDAKVVIQEKDEYCWVAALQFIRSYQHGVLVEQNEIYKTANKRDSDINAGSFLDIVKAFDENVAAWSIGVNDEGLLIDALQQDFPAILALSNKQNKTGHIVLLLGLTYSFATFEPSTTYKVSKFVYDKMLILDPKDGSITEHDADDIIPRIDFMAYNTIYRIAKPLKAVTIKTKDDAIAFLEEYKKLLMVPQY